VSENILDCLTEADKTALAEKYHFRYFGEGPAADQRRNEKLWEAAQALGYFTEKRWEGNTSDCDLWRSRLLHLVLGFPRIPSPDGTVKNYDEWLRGYVDGIRCESAKHKQALARQPYEEALAHWREQVVQYEKAVACQQEQDVDYEWLSTADYIRKYNTSEGPTTPVLPVKPEPPDLVDPSGFDPATEYQIETILAMTPYAVWAFKEEVASVAHDEIDDCLLDWIDGTGGGSSLVRKTMEHAYNKAHALSKRLKEEFQQTLGCSPGVHG